MCVFNTKPVACIWRCSLIAKTVALFTTIVGLFLITCVILSIINNQICVFDTTPVTCI